MKIRCAYSNLELQVTHFPGYLNSREAYHPIFTIPQKKLLQFIRKWGNAELTSEDSYLLFLALLNSTELVEFRTPAIYNPKTTPAIVAANMEQLARIIAYSNVIVHPRFVLPRIVIDKDTQDLKHATIWIHDWTQCYLDFQNGYIQAQEREVIKRREALLESFIKNVNKPINHYAKILADWAAEVAEFPTFPITVNGTSIPLREYWKSIIIKCCKAESIFQIPTSDLTELIEHCEEYIEHGTIYAHTLMELLRAGANRQKNYLGLGDLDISATTYRIISNETSIEDANKQAMIDSAPTEKPTESQYPSKIAYLRAKLKWDMAVEYREQMETAAAISTNIASVGVTTDDGKEL